MYKNFPLSAIQHDRIDARIMRDAITHWNKPGHTRGLQCPTCGAFECHPTMETIQIRAYKVDNYSLCLVCAGYYDAVGGRITPDTYHPTASHWF